MAEGREAGKTCQWFCYILEKASTASAVLNVTLVRELDSFERRSEGVDFELGVSCREKRREEKSRDVSVGILQLHRSRMSMRV